MFLKRGGERERERKGEGVRERGRKREGERERASAQVSHGQGSNKVTVRCMPNHSPKLVLPTPLLCIEVLHYPLLNVLL